MTLCYRNDFPEEKVTAKKTTPTAHSLQSVSEVEVMLTPVKDETAGEVAVRSNRSRASKFWIGCCSNFGHWVLSGSMHILYAEIN